MTKQRVPRFLRDVNLPAGPKGEPGPKGDKGDKGEPGADGKDGFGTEEQYNDIIARLEALENAE